MAVIQAFNRERAFLTEFDSANTANLRTNQAAQLLNSLFFPAIEFFGVVAIASVLLVGGQPARPGNAERRHADLRGLPAQPRLPAAAGAVRPLRAGAVGRRRDGEDLLRPRHRAPRSATSRTRARARQGRRASSTSTRSGSRTAPSRCSAASSSTFPRARCIALVGHTGHGKSTLAKLIGRFYDPDEGAIRVDGVDLRERRAPLVPAPARRRAPGSVPLRGHDRRQHPLRTSRCDRRAGARDRRSRSASTGSPRASTTGSTHVVREGGAGLSAGERQLISIARALLADPRILILDEATSNIDRPTEILIEKRARPAAARPHVDHHRAPPRDRPPRRRDPRRRARPDRAARHRARAARRGRPVPPARARPARAVAAESSQDLVAGRTRVIRRRPGASHTTKGEQHGDCHHARRLDELRAQVRRRRHHARRRRLRRGAQASTTR